MLSVQPMLRLIEEIQTLRSFFNVFQEFLSGKTRQPLRPSLIKAIQQRSFCQFHGDHQKAARPPDPKTGYEVGMAKVLDRLQRPDFGLDGLTRQSHELECG